MDDYRAFLVDKVDFERQLGFQVADDEIHPLLKPHQRFQVRWAVAGGRRALFDHFGLGKTMMQLEIVRLTLAKHDPFEAVAARGLIVLPLGVRPEFVTDAAKLGIDVRFVRWSDQVDRPGIYLTNYESVRDGRLDPGLFSVVSLDEAAVLRSYGSKTFQQFLTLFDQVPYRFLATATPAPNRFKELIHYAGFLGVMDTGQALTRFFQRDSTQANHLTLYPHKEREFWLWLNTWAAFVTKPSDLGFDDDGYVLPGLSIEWHPVAVDDLQADVDPDGQGRLFRGGVKGLTQSAREKRLTMGLRIAEVRRLVEQHASEAWQTASFERGFGDQLIVWCDLNDEQDAIEAVFADLGLPVSSIRGSLDQVEQEDRLLAWRRRDTYALIGKPVMLGQGLNLQQCNTAIYAGVTYKFADTIQSVHRIHRFGQERPCRVHFVYAESEAEIRAELEAKWLRHVELQSTMAEIIRSHGLNTGAITAELTRTIGIERVAASGNGWLVANNDCVVETAAMETDSVDMVLTSIPFANHYEYTPSYNDFGHTDDNAHFWAQMDFLTPQLLRVLRPGRIYCCHVKDRIQFGNVTGAGVPTVSPFHAEAIFHARRHGFDYLGMVTIVTDVVRENNQTYRLGYTEMCKDGTKMGAGSPEYLLIFHKPQSDRSRGYADTPVTRAKTDYSLARWQVDAHAFWRSSGNRPLTPDELADLPHDQLARLFTEDTLRRVYDYETHIAIGEALQHRGRLPSSFMSLAPGSWHPEVWHDVNRMLTLNSEQSRRAVQMHVCPLQFDIVDRAIERWSNPGDLIYDPFGGLMTVPVRAMKAGRRGRGVELNPGYWADGVQYCEAQERQQSMPSLFDLEAS